MVNATEMAKPFGKRPSKWLELPSTKDFLKALSDVRKSDITLVYTKKGNFSNDEEQGTWFHEDVALEFARWLSPVFAVWCNDRIKELLLSSSNNYCAPENQYRVDSGNITSVIERSKLTDAILTAGDDKSLAKVAHTIVMGNGKAMTAPQFYAWLHDNGFCYQEKNNPNMPTEKALQMGVLLVNIPSKKIRYDRPTKERRTITKVTPKGFIYFVNLLSRTLPQNNILVAPTQEGQQLLIDEQQHNNEL
jgi:phage antirepressor YoqD-like protein